MITKTIDVIPYHFEGGRKYDEDRVIKAAATLPQRLKEISGDTIRIREGSVYHANNVKIGVVCMVCGHEWETTPTTLVNNKRACPECARQRYINSAGTNRKPRASKDEKEYARFLRFEKGWTYQKIAEFIGRAGSSTIQRWFDEEYAEKNRKDNRKRQKLYQMSGHQSRSLKSYRQTQHGKQALRAGFHKRRALEYHAADIVHLPEYPDADYQGFVSYDMFDDYVKGDAVAMELFSFEGADEAVKERKKQQDLLTKISGEKYSLEHLIPLSRGGIHHPDNFANRSLKLNMEKGNNRTKEDDELYCKRLFNIK